MIFSPVSRRGQLSGLGKLRSYLLLKFEDYSVHSFLREERNPIILKELFQLHKLKFYFSKRNQFKLSGYFPNLGCTSGKFYLSKWDPLVNMGS